MFGCDFDISKATKRPRLHVHPQHHRKLCSEQIVRQERATLRGRGGKEEGREGGAKPSTLRNSRQHAEKGREDNDAQAKGKQVQT